MLQTVWERHCESPRALEMISQEFGRALNAGGDSAVTAGQASAAPKASSKGGAKPQLGEPQGSLLSSISLASMQHVSCQGASCLEGFFCPAASEDGAGFCCRQVSVQAGCKTQVQELQVSFLSTCSLQIAKAPGRSAPCLYLSHGGLFVMGCGQAYPLSHWGTAGRSHC